MIKSKTIKEFKMGIDDIKDRESDFVSVEHVDSAPDLNERNTARLKRIGARLEKRQQRIRRVASRVSSIGKIGKEVITDKVALAFLGGAAFTLGAVTVLDFIGKDVGRGVNVAACPDDYRGSVEVTDPISVEELARLAEKNEVSDTFAIETVSRQNRNEDVANLAGELACRTGELGDEHVVLLPAGLEALQYSDDYQPIKGQLPDGLEWFSAVPTSNN